MPQGSATAILNSFASHEALEDALAEFILKAQKEAIEKKGQIHRSALRRLSAEETLKAYQQSPREMG